MEFHQPVSGGTQHYAQIQSNSHQQAAEEGTISSVPDFFYASDEQIGSKLLKSH